MAADTYITTQGTVSLQHKDGTSPLYRYGDPVDFSQLTDAQLEHIDRLTGDDPGVKYEKSLAEQIGESQSFDNSPEFRAAMAEAGQVNSTSSPVPANYGELDDDERARFIGVLESNPRSQAVVVAHEMLTTNSKSVIDAASGAVKEIAKRFIEGTEAAVHGPDVHKPGEAEAVPTPVATIPEPTSNPEAAAQAFVDGDPAVASTDAPGVDTEPRVTLSQDTPSPTSTDVGELTGKDLDDRAKELDIEGRSEMSADEKRAAIAEAESTS